MKFPATNSFLESVARRRLVSILLIGVLSFGGSWALSLYRGIPIPWINDEFSYLLAGDTFAHGRLTNPTHPMWIFFESFNVLQHPTYMSMHPPGQGLFLAIGQVFWGHPIYGVWLSSALMCSAICWMLYAWVPSSWALIGGLVSVLQFGVFTYWNQGYFGGSVAAMGGAMIFGALPRIFYHQRTRDALWLGIGMAVVLNTRPLEGLLLIPAGCLLFSWRANWKGLKTPHFIRKIIVPLIFLLLVTIIGICVSNKQITGNSFTFPHHLYAKTYSTVPLMVWQKMGPAIQFNNREMEVQDRDWSGKYFLYKRTWNGFFEDLKTDFIFNYEFYFGNFLAAVALVMALILYIRRGMAPSLISVILCFLFLSVGEYCRFKPHYLAPVTCLVVFFIIEGLRFLSSLRIRKWRLGLMAAVLLIGGQFESNLAHCSVHQPKFSFARIIQSPLKDLPPRFTREDLKEILLQKGGKYLVIVKYLPWHMYYWEWVYNDADIDRSLIVWARDRGSERNGPLLAYFQDRQVIHIEVDWDFYPGKIDKRNFLKFGPAGEKILNRLIKIKILEPLTPSFVRVNSGIDLNRKEILKIAGKNFEGIWGILQRSKRAQIPDYRRID